MKPYSKKETDEIYEKYTANDCVMDKTRFWQALNQLRVGNNRLDLLVRLPYKNVSATLINDDCLTALDSIMPIDLIITSPPYEDIMGAGYGANRKDVLFLKLYSDFINNLFQKYYNALKEGGQIFFNIKSKTFNKQLKTPHWIEFTEGFNLFEFKSYIIWKYAGSFDSTNKRYHLDYEIIYHLSKGDITLNESENIEDSLTSVWYVPHNIPNNERIHPTQMPIKLVDRIFENIKEKNLTVLDTFMGSGTTLVSALEHGHNAIGIELNPDYFNAAKERIEQMQTTLV